MFAWKNWNYERHRTRDLLHNYDSSLLFWPKIVIVNPNNFLNTSTDLKNKD